MWYNIDVTEPHPVATPEARACPAKNSALPRRIIFVEAACGRLLAFLLAIDYPKSCRRHQKSVLTPTQLTSYFVEQTS